MSLGAVNRGKRRYVQERAEQEGLISTDEARSIYQVPLSISLLPNLIGPGQEWFWNFSKIPQNPEITQWRSVELNLVLKGGHISLDRIKYTTISLRERCIFNMAYLGPR